MRLASYVTEDRVLVLEKVQDRDALLRALAEAAAAFVPDHDADDLYQSLRTREEQMPTATPEGVAFPHALLGDSTETIVLAAKVSPAVAMGGATQPATDIVFCMIGSAQRPWDHVRLLARLARIARGEGALGRLRKAGTPSELHSALLKEDESHA